MVNRIGVRRIGDHDMPLPRQESEYAAGFDLRAFSADLIEPGERILIRTGFAWEIPKGYVGLIRPRSGLAKRDGIHVMAGVVDSDYRGQVRVLLVNLCNEVPFSIDPGDRIAQMLIMPVAHGITVEITDLEETKRGDGGFGSTGR